MKVKIKINQRVLYFVLLAVCLAATLNVVWLLIGRLIYEWSGPIGGDAGPYLAMGRGILNGFTPYLDLFIYKPPGIFLVSALSFLLTDTPRLTHVAQVIVLAAVPVMFVVTAWVVGKRNSISKYKMALVLLIALCMGSMLALYTGARAAWVQVESFGSAFIIGYGCLLFLQDKKSLGNRNVIIWLAVLLLCGIGFKEPFLLSALAVALVLCNDWFTFKRGFLVPLLVAGVVGIVLLWAAGWLGPYIRIYLYEVFNGRIETGVIWKKGLNIIKITQNINTYSSWLTLGFLLALLHFLLQGIFSNKKLWVKVIKILVFIVTVFVSVLAVSIVGRFYRHHFVHFVPFVAVLFLQILQTLLNKKKQPLILIIFVYVCVSALIIASLTVNVKTKFQSATWMQNLVATQQQRAKVVDNILESCGEQRYLFFGGIGNHVYPYTRHSPYGPAFFQVREIVSKPMPYMREKLWKSLLSANLVVKLSVEDSIKDRQKYMQYLNEQFTNEPWDCAKNALIKTDTKMGGNKLLYRKGAYPPTKRIHESISEENSNP